MKYIIIALIALAAIACTVSREHVVEWELRVAQAQAYAEQAAQIAERAERLATQLGSQEALAVATEARIAAIGASAVAARIAETPPQEGEPWWTVITGIVAAAAAGWGGYRAGLYHPVPNLRKD